MLVEDVMIMSAASAVPSAFIVRLLDRRRRGSDPSAVVYP